MPDRCREPLDTPCTVNPCKQHSRHAVGHKADAQASQQTRVIFTASRYTATSKTREIGRNRSTQNHNNSFIRACHSQTKRPSRFMLSAMEHCRNTKVFITCSNPMSMTGIRFTHITGTYKKNNAGTPATRGYPARLTSRIQPFSGSASQQTASHPTHSAVCSCAPSRSKSAMR